MKYRAITTATAIILQLYSTLFFTAAQCHALSFEHTVKNFRPITPTVPSPFYRSASLDELSLSDAQALLDGSAFHGAGSSGSSGSGEQRPQPLAAVIDLRNTDEIEKGKQKRTDGSQYFYNSLQYANTHTFTSINSSNNNNNNEQQQPLFYHAPLLQNINAFWDEAINRMDAPTRITATLQTVYSGGALDRAAARHLEEQGLSELYTVMMCSNLREVKRALDICAALVVMRGGEEGSGSSGPILFHCQKGKDRTGVLSMLLQYVCHDDHISEEEIVRLYSLSGDLLGGEDASSKSSTTTNKEKNGGGGGTMLDWSKFRGSPSSAMKETIDWMNGRYGSVDGYLDFINFGVEERRVLRESVEKFSRMGEEEGALEL